MKHIARGKNEIIKWVVTIWNLVLGQKSCWHKLLYIRFFLWVKLLWMCSILLDNYKIVWYFTQCKATKKYIKCIGIKLIHQCHAKMLRNYSTFNISCMHKHSAYFKLQSKHTFNITFTENYFTQEILLFIYSNQFGKVRFSWIYSLDWPL